MNLTNIIILLLAFQVKHFVSDYPLQGKYMLGKFKTGWDFMGPLTAHCIVHSFFTFFIAVAFNGDSMLALGLAAFDFAVHFIMDRIKAGPKYLGRFKAINEFEYKYYTEHTEKEYIDILKNRMKENRFFWWALGIDQMVHHITHYAIIYMLLK